MWIKICGLVRQEDAELAQNLGASALGFVFETTSPRCVGGRDWNPAWHSALKPMKVAVYAFAPDCMPDASFQAVQAFDWSLAGALKDVPKLVVARVGRDDTADRILRRAQPKQPLLLDTFRRDVFGGTGETLNWEVAAEVVRKSKTPVILSGGLTPENVGEAIRTVRPFGVDVSSGLEHSPGIKDHAKMLRFFQEAKAAFEGVQAEAKRT